MSVIVDPERAVPPAPDPAVAERVPLRHRLSTRQALLTVLVALALGLVSSIVEFALALHDEKGRLDESVRLIADMVREPATVAAYEMDWMLAKRLVDGVIGSRSVLSAEIYDNDGRPLGVAHRPAADPGLAAITDRLLGVHPGLRVKLVHTIGNGPLAYVGDCYLTPDTGMILANLRGSLWRMTLSSMIRTAVLAVAIAALFHISTTQPLLRLAGAMAEIEPGRPIGQLLAVPPSHGRDELGAIARAANQLITAFQTSLEERERIGEELRQLASSLERRVAERSAEAVEKNMLLEVSLETMAEAISVFDADFNLMLWNSKYGELLGIPPELLQVGTPLETLVRDSMERGNLRWPGSPEDGVRRWVEEVRHPDPRQPVTRWERTSGTVLEMRRSRMPSGGVVSTYADVTQQALAEGELRRAKEQAESALEELRQTQASLVEAEKMASLAQLVGGVAHEINTPIGIALTAASHFEKKTDELAAMFEAGSLRKSDLANYVETTRGAARFILSNLGRAADLIQSFQRVAVDQASEERRTFDLAEYLGEVILSLRPMLKKTSHEMTVDCPAGIPMDSFPGALSQIITNFIMNSLIHAFDNDAIGHMHLAAHAENGKVMIIFLDDGKGIPAEHLSKIFEPFFTTRRGQGGSGLGLHIVYNLVTTALKGRVSCTSRPGEGTRFVLTVPQVVS